MQECAENVQEGAGNVQEYAKICRDVQECAENVQECVRMCKNVQECAEMCN